jgi:hypothetical protein
MSTGIDTEDPLVLRREKNNPYLTSLELFMDRLQWDLYPDAWVSRAKLKKLKNAHQGEKAIILCNGPSLLKTNFNELAKSGVYTIGLNKINLLFEKVAFRPDCIVSVNQLVLEQNADYFNSTSIELFLDAYARKKKIVKSRGNVIYLHSGGIPRFAKDVSVSIAHGHTVTFVALQLAFHMGFDDVAIIGADHSYAMSGASNMKVNSESIDKSHFDPRYFSGDMTWNLPDLFESEVWYARAQNMYKAHRKKIYNCSVGGELEVFPRKTLEKFLSEK